MSVHVFHAAHLADGQGFARGLQFFLALVVVFVRFKALGRLFVRCGHGAVAGDIFLGFFVVVVLGMRHSAHH